MPKIKQFFRTFIQASAWVLTLGLLVFSGYLVYDRFFANKNIAHIEGVAAVLEKDESVPVNIIEYSLTNYKNDSNPDNDDYKDIYFLGEEGREELSERIRTNLQFGPEIHQLKAINLNRGPSYISTKSKGQYVSAANEIDINLNAFADDLLNIADKKTLSAREKVDMIFPTIYHEYYHHFSSVFLGYTPEMVEKWVKNPLSEPKLNESLFWQNWLSYLNYDKTYKSTESPKPATNHFYNPNNFYTTKQLFDIANRNDLEFANLNYQLIKGIETHDKDDLEYLFSFEELFTRKFQEISYLPFALRRQGWSENARLVPDNETKYSKWYGVYQPRVIHTKIPSMNSLTLELFRNRQLSVPNSHSESEKLSLKKFEQEWNSLKDYIRDNPYNPEPTSPHSSQPSNVREFANLYRELAGYGAPIAQIYEENTTEFVALKGKNPIITKNKNTNRVKISGYIKKEREEELEYVRFGGKNGITFKVQKPTKYRYSNLKFKINPWDLTFTSIDKEEYVPYLATAEDGDYQLLDKQVGDEIEFGFKNDRNSNKITWEIINDDKNSNQEYHKQMQELADYRKIESFNYAWNTKGFVQIEVQENKPNSKNHWFTLKVINN